MNGNAICIVNMGIKNTGSPTIVDGWQFVVRKYGDTYPGRISAAPGNMNTLQFDDYNNARIIVQQADAIYEKTISNPIPTGGQVLGWIVAIVVGINRERLNTEGTIVEVSYKDVRGNSYVASHSIRKTDALGVARYVPGSGGQWEDPRRR